MQQPAAVVETDSSALDDAPEPSTLRWLQPVRRRVLRLPAGLLIWQSAVAVVGFAVVVLGLVLVPLPGPGWVIVFGGFAVWATEFRWAQRLLVWARGLLASWLGWAKHQPRPIQLLIGLAGVAVLAAVFYLSWHFLL